MTDKAGSRGNGAVDATFTACKPDTPAINSAVDNGDGGADVTFTPGNSNNADVKGYEYSTDGDQWNTLSPVSGDTVKTATIPGVAVGGRILLHTVATYGNSDDSDPFTVTAAQASVVPVAPAVPNAPSITGSSTREGEVDLVITPGEVVDDAPVEGYQVTTTPAVESSWQDLDTTPGSGDLLNGKVTNLNPGDMYDLYVRALSGEQHSVPSEKATVQVYEAPAQAPVATAPVIDTATATLPGMVELTFTPGAENGAIIDGWEYSTAADGPWLSLPLVPGTVGQLKGTITGLQPGQYVFHVHAVTANGPGLDSGPSDSVTVTGVPIVTNPIPDPNPNPNPNPDPNPNPNPTPTPTPLPDPTPSDTEDEAPGAPTGVQAVAGTAQVAVSWAAPEDGGDVDHYVVTLQPGGQTCTTTALTCLIGAASDVDYTATVVAVSADGVTGPGTSASVHGTAAAPQVPAEVPSTELTLTTDKGNITSATPGQKITVIGTGFMPYSTATMIIYSDPIVLGTVQTDANGSFSREVEVPTTLAAGQHHLVASGVAPDGTQRFMRMDITVAAANASHDGELAWTGFEATPWVLGGVGAVLLGAVTLLVSRRRAAQR